MNVGLECDIWCLPFALHIAFEMEIFTGPIANLLARQAGQNAQAILLPQLYPALGLRAHTFMPGCLHGCRASKLRLHNSRSPWSIKTLFQKPNCC